MAFLKHCHNNDMEGAYLAVLRFNQLIASFMGVRNFGDQSTYTYLAK